MSYKTILLHVDESRHAAERIKLAATVAMAEHAHLIGTAVTGASRYLLQTQLRADSDPRLGEHLALLRTRAERGLHDFEAAAQKLGLPSFEKRLVNDEAGAGICLQARYADLVVIGQIDPEESSPVVMSDFPQYVMLHCGRPVLLVPHSGHFDTVGTHVLIAWDGSMAVTRTMTAAIPLLKHAQIVEAVTFNAGSASEDALDVEGNGLTLYLGRHGIQVDLLQRKTDGDVGEALIALATERSADLIVMGGYGHARFREILLGGVTRTMLKAMTLPVLMSH